MDKPERPALRISYDRMADVLYLAIGEPKPGVDEEVTAGVYIRVDEETNRPLGLMVVDFERRFSKPIEQTLPIDIAEFFVPA